MCLGGFHAFKAYEEAYHYQNQNVIEESWLQAVERTLLPVAAFQGFRDWWQVTASLFDPDFRTYLESRIENLDPDLDIRDYAKRLGLTDRIGQQPGSERLRSQAIAAVAVSIRLARFACGHHISRAASQIR